MAIETISITITPNKIIDPTSYSVQGSYTVNSTTKTIKRDYPIINQANLWDFMHFLTLPSV